MFKVFAFLKKRDELTTEEFMNYYENIHVPLILSLTHKPLVYKRNYLKSDKESLKLSLTSNLIGFDVVTEQVFKSDEDFQNWLGKLSTPEVALIVKEDEDKFLDRSHYFAYVIDEHTC